MSNDSVLSFKFYRVSSTFGHIIPEAIPDGLPPFLVFIVDKSNGDSEPKGLGDP